MKVGIVGAGWALRAHAAAWRMLPDVEVSAICTAHRETAEAAAAAHAIAKAYWDHRALLDDPEITLIDIATKPSARSPIVMAALAAGKHVHNALPFAMSAPEACAMRDLQQLKHRLGIVDAQFRWIPAMAYMKELIEDGFLGQPYHATFNLHLPLFSHDGFDYPFVAWSNGDAGHLWLGQSSSGASAWRNFGSHALLALSHLLGGIEEVVGRTDTFLREWKLPDGRTFRPDTDDSGLALIRFRSGATASVSATWCTPDAECIYLEVAGSKGRFVLHDDTFGRDPLVPLYAAKARPRSQWERVGEIVDIPERFFQVPGTPLCKANAQPTLLPFARMFDHALQAIEAGREGSPSFAEAAHVHCAVEAVVESMATRSWVKVKDGRAP
jgi:predicted dehydrogenase